MGRHGARPGLKTSEQHSHSREGGTVDNGFMFLLGVWAGGLTMLFVIIRIIAGMHDRWGQNLGKR